MNRSDFSRAHNDHLDPDKHLWPAEDFGNELGELLKALQWHNTQHWDYAPVGDGRGICLTERDADLGHAGQQGIELVGADEEHVIFRVHAGATVSGNDVSLNLRPKDNEDEAIVDAYHAAYLDQAQEIVNGCPFPGDWSGDDWYLRHESDRLTIDWVLIPEANRQSQEHDLFDYAATASALVAAAGEALKTWEAEVGLMNDALDVICGWKDKDGNEIPAKTDADPALDLLPLDERGEPILPGERDEPGDGFLTDAEADADVLRSAGMGSDEDYGSADLDTIYDVYGDGFYS